MDKQTIKNALQTLKTTSPKRKFAQGIDIIVTLKGIDLTKPENQIDLFLSLPYTRGKPIKICGLVAAELMEESKKELDKTISQDEFAAYQKDKKMVKKLAEEYDYFIAQATIMPKIAQTFGRVFGPRQKMPNPKSGCVVPPNANLKPLKERLKNTIRIAVKQKLMFQGLVGKEDQNEDEVIDNILTVYNAILHALPNEEHSIRKVFLKLTMSKPVRIDAGGKDDE